VTARPAAATYRDVGDVLSGLCQEILRFLVVFAASGELLAILGRTAGSCPHCGATSIRRAARPVCGSCRRTVAPA